MRNILRALFAACIISVLGSIAQASVLIIAKINFDKVLLMEMKLPSEDRLRIIGILTDNYYKTLYWHLAECGVYLTITVLLIFAIRGLKVSESLHPA